MRLPWRVTFAPFVLFPAASLHTRVVTLFTRLGSERLGAENSAAVHLQSVYAESALLYENTGGSVYAVYAISSLDTDPSLRHRIP